MDVRTSYRLTAVAGFGFVVAAITNAILILSMGPGPSAAVPVQVAGWAADHRRTLLTTGWLTVYTVLILVAFLFGVGRLAEPRGGGRSLLLNFGATVLFGFSLLDVVLLLSLPDAAARADGRDAATLWGVIGTVDKVFQMADVIFFIGLAALIFHTRVLPVAFAWTASALATMTVVFGPLAQATGLDFLLQLPISLLILWVLGASVVILLRSSTTSRSD